MEIKERIIENASVLFFQNGIKSMTMSDIANDLGISKRTLYEVFRDKEELLDKCIEAHMLKADLEIEALVTNSEDTIDVLMRIYVKHLNKMRSVNKSVLHDLKKYHSTIYKKIECKQKEGMHNFIPLFERGVEQGLIRDDINCEILIWLLKSQFRALMEDDYMPTDKYSTDEFVSAIIFNFIRGIATPLGNEKVDNIIERLKDESENN
jgi:AcrR family transcriptional regulator